MNTIKANQDLVLKQELWSGNLTGNSYSIIFQVAGPAPLF